MGFLGTIDWINKMNWKDKEDWKASPRVAFSEGDHIEGYIKKSNNFALYWVERSGHMVMIKKRILLYSLSQFGFIILFITVYFFFVNILFLVFFFYYIYQICLRLIISFFLGPC